MKRRLFLFLAAMMLAAAGAVAQSTMTDQQLVQYILEQKERGTSQQEIVTQLIQRGVDIQQIQRVRRKYERQINQAGLGVVADQAVTNAQSRMRQYNGQERRIAADLNYRTGGERGQGVDPTGTDFMQMQAELGGLIPVDSLALLREILDQQQLRQNQIFGHDIFNNEALSFEPNMNVPTPSDYRLGPGDAVVIEIYGASQETISATISPEGTVTVEGCGPVQLSGLTVAQANARLRSQLGPYYSSSQISLSVGQTRTILVNVMGEVRMPGTYTLSAFSTVFNALYMAGGVNDIGTLRDIRVFRNNRQVSTIDVYDYILNGKASGNVRLTDNDVIIVGPYDCLVSIGGRVKRPMFFEMKQGESLASLLKYSGGFTGDAYRSSVRVLRRAGAMHSVHTVGEFDYASFGMADGDSVLVDSVLSRYANMAEVRGAVFRPGMFELGGAVTSVRSLIQAAGGLTEEAFTPHAVLHRMNPDRTLQVLAVDVAAIMADSLADVALQNEDVLYLPTRMEALAQQTITIHGEVQYPGIYRYAENETLEDFVLQAGGLTEAASVMKVDVSRRIIDPHATTSQDTIAHIFTFALRDGFVIDGEQAFHLQPYDEVYVRRSPGYTEQENVVVDGEVMYAGTYTLAVKGQRLSEIVNNAGGLKPTAYAQGARLIRQRTPEERARQDALVAAARRSAGSGKDSIDISKLDLGATYTVGIDLEQALNHPGSDADIQLRDGDRIFVPEYSGTVKISGEVMYPNSVSFASGKKLSYYVNLAGGYGDRAKKRQTYIIYMNGNVAKADRKHKPQPGCEIVVPTKQQHERMSTAEIMTIGTASASIATMIATLVNLLK